jgi:hypothetical protein
MTVLCLTTECLLLNVPRCVVAGSLVGLDEEQGLALHYEDGDEDTPTYLTLDTPLK